jgi:protein phosphatase
MLCSDGAYDGASAETIQSILAQETDPEQAADKIVQAALKGGSKDNITCVVVHVL